MVAHANDIAMVCAVVVVLALFRWMQSGKEQWFWLASAAVAVGVITMIYGDQVKSACETCLHTAGDAASAGCEMVTASTPHVARGLTEGGRLIRKGVMAQRWAPPSNRTAPPPRTAKGATPASNRVDVEPTEEHVPPRPDTDQSIEELKRRVAEAEKRANTT